MFFWLNIFKLEMQGQGLPTARGGGGGGGVSVSSFSSSPAVNLVGFSVTFIREGDLVHLKRQMKELEANYQEIEKR